MMMMRVVITARRSGETIPSKEEGNNGKLQEDLGIGILL